MPPLQRGAPSCVDRPKWGLNLPEQEIPSKIIKLCIIHVVMLTFKLRIKELTRKELLDTRSSLAVN